MWILAKYSRRVFIRVTSGKDGRLKASLLIVQKVDAGRGRAFGGAI